MFTINSNSPMLDEYVQLINVLSWHITVTFESSIV